MTATTQDIKADKLGTEELPPPALLALPCEANTIIYGGTPVFNDAAGNAVDGTPGAGALYCWGRCERQVNNLSSNSPFGAAGAQQVPIRPGVYYFAQDGSVGVAQMGRAVYALDNQTATANPVQSMTSTTWLPFLGIVQPPGLNEFGLNLTGLNKTPVYLGYPSSTGMVFHANIPVTLANIQAQTSGVAFNLGPVTPAGFTLIDMQFNLVTLLTGGGETGTTISIQGGTDAAGTIQSTGLVNLTSGTVGAYASFGGSNPGTNPYSKRGAQQLKGTLTQAGGTLAGLTAGAFNVDVWYTLAP